MSNKGSLGYQMMTQLKTVFHPGHSRYQDKLHNREDDIIRGIETMRDSSAVVHQFSRFIRSTWPKVKDLEEVTPEMARAYISELVRREDSSGQIGKVCSTIRRLDRTCRKNGIFPKDMPALLPYQSEGGPGGFHSEYRSIAYSDEQARQIISVIMPEDPASGRLLSLMLAAGLRVTEACYLRTQDIDLHTMTIALNASSNVNRTKGGRPRVIHYSESEQDLMIELKKLGEGNPTGHIFKDRHSLPDRARSLVRQTCEQLEIPCLGTHGFRKTFAQSVYAHKRTGGQSDSQALLDTARELGHNRVEVTHQSYVSVDARKPNSRSSK